MALAGSFTTDITPNKTVDLNGYILRFGRSRGVHDPLTANLLYLESENEKALIVSMDILTISNQAAARIIKAVSEQCGINEKAIILAAIHTHSAVGAPYLRNVGVEDEEWEAEFEYKIIEGAKAARKNAVECSIYSYEAYSAMAVNRRKETRGIDQNAPFFVVKNKDKIIAWVVNYNCHAVCLTEKNLQISADYVYYLRKYLYEKTGQNFPVLFLNGGSGDADPQKRGSFFEAKYTGEKLADELLTVYNVYPGQLVDIDIKYKMQKLSIPYGWRPDVEEAEKNLREYTKKYENSTTKEESKINGAFKIWANDLLIMAKSNSLPKQLDVNITVIKIGSLMFFAIPLEIFSSISQKLRKHFSNSLLFVVSYGNGYCGYLADKTAHYEGGYEIQDWHKYAGILPQAANAEELLWEAVKKIKIK